jgi:hypothetical protein
MTRGLAAGCDKQQLVELMVRTQGGWLVCKYIVLSLVTPGGGGGCAIGSVQ